MNTHDYAHGDSHEWQKFMNFLWELPLEMNAKLLYLALWHAAAGQGHTFVSQDRLSYACCCTARTVQRLLPKLEEAGLVRQAREGRKLKYILIAPDEEEWADPPQGPGGDWPSGDNLSYDTGDKKSSYDNMPDNMPHIMSTGDKLSPEKGDNLSYDTGDKKSSYDNMPDNMSHIMPTGDSLSPEKGDNLSLYDNFVPVLKKEEKERNTPPLPPKRQRRSAGGGGGGIPADASLEAKIQKDFQRLSAAYPCKAGFFEAFKIYGRMYAQLPPVEELLRLLDYERAHNGKWQRQEGRFVPWLKNWLRFQDYEQTRQFMALEQANAAAAGLAADSERPVEPQREEEDDGFEIYAALWSDRNEGRRSMAKSLWRGLLRVLGAKPALEEAREASLRYPAMYHWLHTLRATRA